MTRKFDVLIVILYLCWAGYTFFEVLSIYSGFFNIAMGVCFAILFPLAVSKTQNTDRQKRLDALKYAVTFMIAFPCGVKIVEITRDLNLPVSGLSVVLTGVFLQSIYFLFVSRKAFTL